MSRHSDTPNDAATADVSNELKRELSSFSNFSVSFSIISVITGICSLYGNGMVAGGPAMLVWGWLIVSILTTIVALAMAEICSAYPRGGGPYVWSCLLAGEKHGPFISWLTGWFNLSGQFAIVAGIDFGLAVAITAVISIFRGPSFSPPPPIVTYAIYLLILLSHALLNTFSLRAVSILNGISVWWHLIGVFVLSITVLAASVALRSPQWVFTHWESHTNLPVPYTALIGLLMSQYTMTGFDASAQMTDETKRADVAAPVAIVLSVVVSFFAGWFLILCLTFSIQDYDAVLHSPTGMPVAQIFLDATGPIGALFLLLIVMGAMFFCGNACVTSNSRMLHAFAGDRALPASHLIHRIHPTYRTPVHAIWLSVLVAAVLGLLSLVSTEAFTAITSLATVSLYIAYGIPIACRLLSPTPFSPGPMHLGRWGTPVAIISVLWVLIITIGFCLPTSAPVTLTNMNWAAPLILLIIIGSLIAWYAGMSSRFHGPSEAPLEHDVKASEEAQV